MFLLYCLVQGHSINFGKIILKCLRANSGKGRGKIYFPHMITQLLKEGGIPSYKEDVIVKETGGKWQIDLKAVARLRDRKDRAAQNEVPGMLQDLLVQNSSLMDSMLQQRSEFLEKLESIRSEVKAKAKKEWKKKKAGLEKKHKKEVKRLKKEKTELKKEVLFLKNKLEITVPDAAASQQPDQQPTPEE
ncbi:hypothetical protein L6452_20745 [Arctium lappa]|uniref:Uncharacterized protein n=1 Tax=Arctium lappa TaxID=4217 RepID=A0ACB9BC98_ARCLA|nr:hypothetical protein L6452_20745 [Arctium lappa]